MALNLVFCLGTFASLSTFFMYSIHNQIHLIFHIQQLLNIRMKILTVKLTVVCYKIINHCMVWSLVILFLVCSGSFFFWIKNGSRSEKRITTLGG